MVSRGVHERTAEHSLIADIQMSLWKSVCRVFSIVVKTLMLIEKIQRIFYSVGRSYSLRCLFLRTALSSAAKYTLCGQRQKHIVKKYVRRAQNTVLLAVAVFVNIAV